MSADPALGTKIRKRRQVLRLTQEELAAQLGVSKSTVAHWESGKHFPRRYLGAVEDVLGITLDRDGEAGPLDDLLPAHDDWELEVFAADLPDYIRRDLLLRSRAARAEYRAEMERRRLAAATSRRAAAATAAESEPGRQAG